MIVESDDFNKQLKSEFALEISHFPLNSMNANEIKSIYSLSFILLCSSNPGGLILSAIHPNVTVEVSHQSQPGLPHTQR